MAVQTPLSSILYFLVAAFLGALGQFLYKSGAERATGALHSYFLNVRILGGVVCYIAVMVLFVAAFRRGGGMGVLFPPCAATLFCGAFFPPWASTGSTNPVPAFC